jgi:predicted transposase/invertase (TIGR01784 family)
MFYLDPKNDITFKKVFGEHPKVLISLLNAVLPLKQGSKITEIEYLPAELLPDISELKNTIVDIRCRDNKGKQFVVEIPFHKKNKTGDSL